MRRYFFFKILFKSINFYGYVAATRDDLGLKPSVYHTMIQDEKLPFIDFIKSMTHLSSLVILGATMTNFIQGEISIPESSAITGVCIGGIASLWTLLTTCFFEKFKNKYLEFLGPFFLFLFLLITGLLEVMGEYAHVESGAILTGNKESSFAGKVTAISTLSTSFLVGCFQIIYKYCYENRDRRW